jgi:hypothetical protein
MRLTFLFSFIGLIVISLSSSAQRGKVKRKGVKVINVTKSSNNTSSYSLKQFEGKWQEASRKDRENNSSVDFTDTLFLRFYGDDNVFVRNGKYLSVTGSAEIEPGDLLAAAGDDYIIKSLDNTKVVLDDGDKYIHTMIKTKDFWFETLPTDSVMPERYMTPVAVSLSDISGNWAVYRRNASPGATGADEALIKKLTIENKSTGEFNGEVTFYLSGKTETLPGSITVDDNKINIITTRHSWQMDVYKATKEELIFGNKELMYYTKPF